MSQKQFLKFWIWGLLLKLGFSAWLPLFSDEAYYWVWSHHLQLSYYDHPPFIAWLIRLGHFLEPYGNMVRWPAVLFAHFTLWIWYQILKGQIEERKLLPWMAMAFFTPMTGLGSMILTPDLPIIFFWSVALLAMDRAIREKQLKWYLLLGAALGLGFCSKYHAVLFVPFAFLWIAIEKLWKELRWKYLFYSVLVGLLFCSPVWIWNAQNDWISFKFQLNHGLGDNVWKPKYTWRYLYGQIALVFPVVLFFAFKARKLKTLTWLPVFSWAPLIFFLFTSFKGKVEANWPSVAYPSIIVLALMGSKASLNWVKWTVGFWVAAAIGIAVHIVHPWLPLDHKRLKTYELEQYKIYKKISDSYQPYYTSTYQLASKIWYETKRPTYKLRGIGRKDFYDYLDGSFPKTETYFFSGEFWVLPPPWAREKGHRIVRKFPVEPKKMLFEVRSGDK